MQTSYRTHTCGALRAEDQGSTDIGMSGKRFEHVALELEINANVASAIRR